VLQTRVVLHNARLGGDDEWATTRRLPGRHQCRHLPDSVFHSYHRRRRFREGGYAMQYNMQDQFRVALAACP